MAKKKLRLKKSAFQVAVAATKDVSGCYKDGLKAFEKDHSHKIICDQSKVEGSLFIDQCLAKKDHGNRWDYAFGYNGKVYFVEVHSAVTSEVKVVLKKLQWLKDWLNSKAPELNKRKATGCYHWLQSGKFDIPPHMPQYKHAQQNGIMPKPLLKLN